jgi:cytochrome b561
MSADTASADGGAVAAATVRYGDVAIALHWLVALLVVVQVGWGWAMQDIPKAPPGLRADAFNTHKSIGLAILALTLLRLGWRLRHPAPPLPPMPRWQRTLARGNHGVLYAALVLMAVSGYVGSVFSGYPVKAFGVVLPAWGWKDEGIKSLMSSVHLATSWLLLAAIALHVAGALRHALVAGDRVLERMLPRRQRSATARRAT